MKNSAIIILVFLFVTNCDTTESSITNATENAYREAAYNSLTDSERESIISDWHTAPIRYGIFTLGDSFAPKIKLDGNDTLISYTTPMSSILPEGERIVTITFRTSNDPLLGPIVVILRVNGIYSIGFFSRL